MSEHSAIACAIYELAAAVRSHGSNASRPVTKNDLVELEDNLSMKITQIAAASDPDVTDEQFLQDLNDAQADAAALAAIVPGSPTPGGGTSDGSSTPQP